MKKIVITLCTLLAVGYGEYAQAMRGEAKVDMSKPDTPVDVSKAQKTSGKIAEIAVDTPSIETESKSAISDQREEIVALTTKDIAQAHGLDLSQLTDQSISVFSDSDMSSTLKSADRSVKIHTQFNPQTGVLISSTHSLFDPTTENLVQQTVYDSNGNFEITTHDANQEDPKPYEGPKKVLTQTKNTSDGGWITSKFDPKTGDQLESKQFNSHGKLVDSNGNSITRETVQNMDATEKASTQAEFEAKVAETEAANPEAAKAAQTQIEAKVGEEQLSEKEQDVVNANLTEAINAQTPDEKMIVVQNVGKDLTSETPLSESAQSSLVSRGYKIFTAIPKLTNKSFSGFVKTMSRMISRSTVESRITQETGDASIEVKPEIGRTSMESQSSESGLTESLNAQESSASRSDSPTGVADDLFAAKEKPSTNAGKPGTIKNGRYTPVERDTPSGLRSAGFFTAQ